MRRLRRVFDLTGEIPDVPGVPLEQDNAESLLSMTLPFPGGTRGERQHVRRAAHVLNQCPDLERKKGRNSFFEAVRERAGKIGCASGEAIWRGVRRCAEDAAGLDDEPLPLRYSRMDGFRRLVSDLTSGNFPA